MFECDGLIMRPITYFRETNQGLLLDTPNTKLEKNGKQRKDPFSPFEVSEKKGDSVFKSGIEGYSWLECMSKKKAR